MVFHNFDELIAHVKGQPSRARMAVAAAGDAHTIEAVLRARAEGIVTPILVGDKAVIDQVLAELGEHIPAEDIHDEPDLAEAARKAVALVRAGEADFLMKGKLDTSVLLKAVVNKETGLGKGGVMSHFTAFEIPTYHKLLMPVDGGMVTYPTLEQKKAIIENTVGALRAMGYDCPKVGVLACVEKLNPKMPETVEGDALKQMNQRGELTGCVVEGPISYDCAVSRGPQPPRRQHHGQDAHRHLQGQDGRLHRGRPVPHRHDQPRLLRRGEVSVHRHLRRGRPESVRRNPNGATFDSQPRLYVHQAGCL